MSKIFCRDGVAGLVNSLTTYICTTLFPNPAIQRIHKMFFTYIANSRYFFNFDF